MQAFYFAHEVQQDLASLEKEERPNSGIYKAQIVL
jgi:hypothetical protein